MSKHFETAQGRLKLCDNTRSHGSMHALIEVEDILSIVCK